MPHRVAVLDIGSNSVLALVAERVDGEWRRVWEECEVTRLGEGLVESGPLSRASMARTAEAVERLLTIATSHDAERVEAVGTMAFRLASNRDDFLRSLPIAVRVLSGEEEARYSFHSVARDPLFREREGLVVIDIGGASTELATESSRQSASVGALRVVKDYLGQGPCESEAIFRAGFAIDEALAVLAEPTLPIYAVTVGATGVNLACLQKQLPHFDPDPVHGVMLDYEFVAKAATALCKMTFDERDALPSMEPKRAASIHGGALILERMLQRLHVEAVTVSNRGLRWGVLEDF